VPRDVLQHRCIGFRHRGESKYRWESIKATSQWRSRLVGRSSSMT
jgi:hypothetical protein